MKTVRRNSKKLSSIWDNGHDCKCHTLRNDFIGNECEIEWAKKTYDDFNFAVLREESPGQYCLSVHSNEWYNFKSC